jgi:murein DD-endopeptidase MepM/ murein hydrolase activator NlpD
MTRRKLFVVAVAAAAALAFGTVVLPASAELRTFKITLLGGGAVTVTVDVAPGTPVDQIEFPTVTGPILDVVEIDPPVNVQNPTSSPQPEPAPPEETPTPEQQQQGGEPDGQVGDEQKSTSDKKRKQSAAGDANTQALVGEVEQSARKTVDEDNGGRHTDGTPTLDNPSFALAIPGAAPIGVPNFFIDKFRIPPFLLPIYQAAGTQYGIRWEVLAAINEIETDYGRNLNVSSAGALGWMQFMPATWKSYGTDANKDGVKDPYNPVDAIFAAARYLKAAGAEQDLQKAIFAYNHADWYVDSVLMRARLIGGLPSNFVGSLTGLTQGRFPVHAKATYADDLSEKEMVKRTRKGENAAYLVEGSESRRGIKVYARNRSRVVAVQDGKIVRIGHSKRLGRYVMLQDVYGNTYTYAKLGEVSKLFPAPRYRSVSRAQVRKELNLPKTVSEAKKQADKAPTGPASTTTEKSAGAAKKAAASVATARPAKGAKDRLFANPARDRTLLSGGADQIIERGGKVKGFSTFKGYFSAVFGLNKKDVTLRKLKVGSSVAAGTVLGRIGKTSEQVAPHLLFEIRPAGRGAPRIDPKPILDGWKLLESTAIYRAAGKNPFFGKDAKQPSIGQILLMSKEALVQRVLSNPRVEVYECGRRDVRVGNIDRRVLATLEFLAASGFKPTVTSLKCGHGFYTKSGNVSHHSSGNAVDIAKVNGIPVLGHQGPGSITEMAVQRLLTLQGMLKPDQIITLMEFEGTDNTYAMGDHDDHIHVGWRPLYGTNSKAAKQVNAILKPEQWIKLIDRLGKIDNPEVLTEPSDKAIKVVKRASTAHKGE